MTAAINRRNRRATTRSRRRAGASWTGRAADRRRPDTDTFTYSHPMFLTAVDGPSGRLATYVYDSESKRRRIYEGPAFTTLVWDGWDYLQWRRPSGTPVFHTMNGEIVGESVGGTVRDYLLDPLGSVVATLDSSGLVDQFEYWPYGELVDDLPEGAPVFLWVGGLGYWFDTDERRYVRHRMLRNDLGSWMQLDPLWPRTPGNAYVPTPVGHSDRSCLGPGPCLFEECFWSVVTSDQRPSPFRACVKCSEQPYHIAYRMCDGLPTVTLSDHDARTTRKLLETLRGFTDCGHCDTRVYGDPDGCCQDMCMWVHSNAFSLLGFNVVVPSGGVAACQERCSGTMSHMITGSQLVMGLAAGLSVATDPKDKLLSALLLIAVRLYIPGV